MLRRFVGVLAVCACLAGSSWAQEAKPGSAGSLPPPPDGQRRTSKAEESLPKPVDQDKPTAPKTDDDQPADVSPGTNSDAKDKADADRHLRNQGLRPDGLVYVLDQEDDLARMAAGLQLAATEMQAMFTRMGQVVDAASRIQLLLVGAQRELENAYVADQFASAQAIAEVTRSTTTTTTTGNNTTKSGGNGNTSTPGGTTTTTTTGVSPDRQIQLAQEAAARRQLIVYYESQVYNLRSQLVQASMEYDRLNTGLMFKQAELDRGQLMLMALADQIARRYDDLAHDSAVKAALQTINKGAKKPRALGPREDYKANVKKMAAELLESRKFVVEKGGKVIQLKAEKEVGTLAYLARRYVDELKKAQLKQQDNLRSSRSHETRLAQLESRDATLIAAVATAESSKKLALEAELATVRKDLDRYRKDLAADVESRKAIVREVAEKREGLVQIVDALKKAAEIKTRDEQAVEGDEEVQSAIQKFKPARRPGRGGTASAAKASPADVYSRAIHKAEISLSPDKIALWVNARVNEQAERKFVVDPTVETVRLSARTAAELKIDVPASAPSVNLTLPDGRNLHARRVLLKSIALGPGAAAVVANDVDGLVLLDGYDGPPRLGASFFDRFVTRIEPESARLSLTQVDLKALPASAAPRPANAASPKPKAAPKANRGGSGGS